MRHPTYGNFKPCASALQNLMMISLLNTKEVAAVQLPSGYSYVQFWHRVSSRMCSPVSHTAPNTAVHVNVAMFGDKIQNWGVGGEQKHLEYI